MFGFTIDIGRLPFLIECILKSILGTSCHYYIRDMKNRCQHLKHKEYLEAFLKRFPTANRDTDFAIMTVDPEHWYISDDQKKNTVKCCRLCSISEDIKRASSRNIVTPAN